MSKFMCTHTVPPGAFTADQLTQVGKAAQEDPTVKGYRSFANLGEGKLICVMEAPDKAALSTWFDRMGIPCDAITEVELEGERGVIKAA